MNRFRTFFALALLLVSSFVAMGLGAAGVAAQDTPALHPIVGIWVADTDPEITDNADSVFTFSDGGGYVELHPDGEVLIGRWESTGENTANLTIVSTLSNDDESPAGTFIIRGTIEVAADTKTFTATYTFELINPDGTSLGQAGPGQVIGERVDVEAPGTPVMTIDELFTMSQGADEATPVP